MRQAIGDILPLAIGVAISPVPIIAVILMLFSAKAKANGVSFLLGWIVGLGVVSAVVYTIADSANTSSSSSASDGSSTARVILGVVLLLMAIRHWRTRPAPGEPAPMPKWMAAVDTITPPKAFGLAFLLSAVNPKNLLLTAGAAAAVAQAGVSSTDAVITLAIFVLLASLTIAVPVILTLVGGDKVATLLNEWKAWLSENNATVMSILLLVFGVVLVGQGIGAFS